MTTQAGPDPDDLLGGSTPVRRVTSPPQAVEPSVHRIGRVQVVAGVVVLVLVLGLGGAFAWRQVRGTPADLSVGGAPVANAAALLADGADVMRRVVATDGGTIPDGAGCWFAPRADGAPATAGPRVACGPVRLGVAGDDERWLVDEPQWSTGVDGQGGARATGVFDGFDGVADLREHLLRRPDGARPPAGEPTLGTDGLRTENGRVLTNAASVLAQVERSFAAAARTSGATTSDDAQCWLGAREATRAGVTVQLFTERVWCGPVLLSDSGPTEFWTTIQVPLTVGDTLVEAVASEPTFDRVDDTRALEDGVVLVRPDGGTAPTSTGDLEPPPGDPVAPGTVRVLAALPPDPSLELVEPADGRLVTPAVSLRITGLGRTPTLGTGVEGIAAPAEEELVVATFAVTRPDDAPSARGTATVVADGVRLAVPDFATLADGAAIVASVPQGAQDIVLEVLFEDRVQRISLVTGERAAGAPAVLYRERTSVGVGAPIAVEVVLPAGDPARASGAVAEAALSAWHPDRGWSDDGSAYLTILVTDWSITEPCCDARGLDVTAAWSLDVGDAVLPVLDAGVSGTDVTLLLAVPEDLVAATLVLDLTAAFEGGPASARATAPLELAR
ncbi:hypothetical protein [Cellulomonas sp. S1-8]|uniref:hypothetical protein n=1 Tax=Cellulomonas sp. S1-8 TaxID=2904790 RepID=UPI00224454F3|nr:hypothetical protein [Cellulomonas sp. S1-8]UZN02114.1 hypothetical protein OKX07_13590 [Cellulomonas sp. S1-8]